MPPDRNPGRARAPARPRIPAVGAVEPVRSAQNPRLQAVRALRAGRDREHLLLEGPHLLQEALDAELALDWVLYDPVLHDPEIRELLQRAEELDAEVLPCARALLDEVSDLDSPRGLLAMAPRPEGSAAEVLAACARKRGLVLVCCGVQDPGNAGAVVRAAAGLGASGVIAVQGGASLWHPRALRGASGATFRLPVADRVERQTLLAEAARAAVELWAAEAGGRPLPETRRAGPVALLLGEEGRGLAEEWLAACSARVSIPLQRGVESLNVATAAAVLTFALARP